MRPGEADTAETQGLRGRRRRIPIPFIRPSQEVTPCDNTRAEPETTAAGRQSTRPEDMGI